MTLLITNRQTEERGNGTNRNFYFDFPVLNADELFVYIKTDGVDGSVLRTDYTITGLGNANGGSIYFSGGSAPTSAQVVHIQRWVENTQETNYVENDPFPADAHEDTLDRMVMMIQQTLQFEGVAEPGHMLMWDAHGEYVINGPDGDDIAEAEEHAALATQAYLDALAAALAARNWAGGALNTNFTYAGLTSKSAYHWATVAMVYTVFPLNTVCWFGQSTAPIGWTIQTGYTDCLIGVKSETPGTPYYVNTNPWTQRSPSGGRSTWKALDMDADGSFIIAGVFGTWIYKSEDYGVNWSKMIMPSPYLPNSYFNWAAAAVDDTGTNAIIAVAPGRVFTSSNYGVTWIERQPNANSDFYWGDVDCSSDGTIMYACINYDIGGKVFKSVNSGANWSEILPKGGTTTTGQWQTMECSGDGSIILIGEQLYGSFGKLYKSNNYGAAGSWTQITNTPAGSNLRNWSSVAVSRSGQYMVAAISSATNGRVYLSTDYGVNWTETYPMGSAQNKMWSSISISNDGQVIMAGVYNGLLYRSINGGATWTETMPWGYSGNRNYMKSATSADGTRHVVDIFDSSSYGYVYTYSPVSTGSSLGTWSLGSHAHTQTVHAHSISSISITLPSHNHTWHIGPDGNTYDVSGNVIAIGNYKSSKTTTGLINEVTKANSRKADATFYTSFATAAGGTATATISNSDAVNTGTTDLGSTWRPKAAMGIIAKLTTIPTA